MHSLSYTLGTEVVYYSVVRQACDIIDQEHFYESMGQYRLMGSSTEPFTSRNTAYNQVEIDNSTFSSGELQTTTNTAYGTLTSESTTMDDSQDYYVNEELQNRASSLLENSAYCELGQRPSSCVTGSLDDVTSIPTTRNEAYNDSDSERTDTEETISLHD